MRAPTWKRRILDSSMIETYARDDYASRRRPPPRGCSSPCRRRALRARRRGARGRAASAGRDGRNEPSTTLSAIPSPSARSGAEEPLRPTLRDPAVEHLDQQRVRRDGPAEQLGVRAHRATTRVAAVERAQARERVRPPLERQRERRHAAPVDRRSASTPASTSASAATSWSIACWHGCSASR